MPVPPETPQNRSALTRQDKTVRDLSAEVEELQTEIDTLRRENAELKRAAVALRRANTNPGSRVKERPAGLDRVNARFQSEREGCERTEATLRESEEKYRLLFDSIDEGFCIVEVLFDEAGTPVDYAFLEANQAFVKQTGMHDAVGKRMRELYPAHEEHWFQIYGEIAKTGKPQRFVEPANLIGGWYEVYAFRIGGDESNRVAILFNDISERKRAENELILSERNLAASQEIAHVGSYSWDLEKNLLTWSDELYRILGLAPQEIPPASDTYTACIHPDDRDEAIRKIRSAVEEGEPQFNEHRIIRPDGTVRFMQVRSRVYREERGKPKLIQGVVQDITERKRAEAALRESKEKLQTLFQCLPVGISILDEHRKVLKINPVLGDILDLSRDDLLHGAYENRRYIRLDRTEMPAAEFPSNRVITEQTAIRNVEIGIIKEDGSTIWTNVSAVPLPFSDWRMLLTTSDITGRKRTEEALRRRTEDLVRQSQGVKTARDEANMYLDIMTHDVRNANNVSNIYADLLVELLAGDQWLYARKLRDAVQRSSEILRNVATIRRLQQESDRQIPMNFDAVIKEEIENFPGTSIRYDSRRVDVLADGLLPVIFTNLIGNAVKFGGPDVEISIEVEEQDGEVLVTVADTGQGVPDEVKAKLFTRFERGVARGKGEGLGLYIVRTLVERYGGKIWIDDRVPGRPEEGAAFRFTLQKIA